LVFPPKSKAEALAQTGRNLVYQIAGFIPLGILD